MPQNAGRSADHVSSNDVEQILTGENAWTLDPRTALDPELTIATRQHLTKLDGCWIFEISRITSNLRDPVERRFAAATRLDLGRTAWTYSDRVLARRLQSELHRPIAQRHCSRSRLLM